MSGLYEYKTHGVMEDLDPEICAMVYLDWEYRKKWDTYVIGKKRKQFNNNYYYSRV